MDHHKKHHTHLSIVVLQHKLRSHIEIIDEADVCSLLRVLPAFRFKNQPPTTMATFKMINNY